MNETPGCVRALGQLSLRSADGSGNCVERTFWDRKESDECNRIFVTLPHVVLDIPRGHVQWVEIVLASCNRGGCLVAAQINRHEHCTMSVRILSNFVLDANRHTGCRDV